MTLTKAKPRTASDEYFELFEAFPLRPLRSSQAHEEANRLFRELSGRKSRSVSDYRSVLRILIRDYEREHIRADWPTRRPADVVRFLMSEQALSANALAKKVAISQSSLSDMLNGKRAWSRSAIQKLSAHFGLSPAIFFERAS